MSILSDPSAASERQYDALPRFADYECPHGRLAGDKSDPCGCWPEEHDPGEPLAWARPEAQLAAALVTVEARATLADAPASQPAGGWLAAFIDRHSGDDDGRDLVQDLTNAARAAGEP